MYCHIERNYEILVNNRTAFQTREINGLQSGGYNAVAPGDFNQLVNLNNNIEKAAAQVSECRRNKNVQSCIFCGERVRK